MVRVPSWSLSCSSLACCFLTDKLRRSACLDLRLQLWFGCLYIDLFGGLVKLHAVVSLLLTAIEFAVAVMLSIATTFVAACIVASASLGG